MRILLDMDGVIVNLMEKWIYYYNKKYGSRYKRKITSWDFKQDAYPWDTKENDWIEILQQPGFSADLRLTDPEWPYVIRNLQDEGHSVHIVTAGIAYESLKDKYSWVHTNLRIPGFIDTMDQLVQTRDKSIVRGDLLLDDRPKVFNGEFSVWKYEQPWNINDKNYKTIVGARHFLDQVRRECGYSVTHGGDGRG